MKRLFRICVLVLLMMMVLSGCGGSKKEEETVKPSFELGGKTFYNTVDNYGHEDHSWVWFGKDGSFVINDSYADGTYEISGKWSLSENVCSLDAEKSGKGSFSRIIFEVEDSETLKLKTSLEGSKADDLFSTTEIKGSTVTPKEDKKDDSKTDTSTTDSSSKSDSSSSGKSETKIPCTSITSLYHNYWSYVGTKDWDLEIRALPENTTDEITFKSNDEKVVKIDSKGRATAVGVGKTTIDVTCGDKKLSVGYEVRDKNASSSPEGAGVAKTYKAKFKDVYDEFQPNVFFDSGFFTFTENVYAGMGQYKGTYEIKDGEYICKVTDAKTMEGFAGDKVKEIVFKIVDEKTLKLKTMLCMSGPGDLFYLK